MQIVADQEHAAADLVADLGDQMIKRGLAGDVDAGERFVEHQEIGPPGNGARQQRPGELAARKRAQLPVLCRGDADAGERRLRSLRGGEKG